MFCGGGGAEERKCKSCYGTEMLLMKHWVQPAAWQASLGKLPCCRSTPTKRAEAFQTILHKVGWAKGIESFRHHIQHIDLNFVMVTLSENNQTWLLEIMVCCFQIFSCSCYFENKYNYFLDKEGLCRKERISVHTEAAPTSFISEPISFPLWFSFH